jgi:hypothetical protein
LSAIVEGTKVGQEEGALLAISEAALEAYHDKRQLVIRKRATMVAS